MTEFELIERIFATLQQGTPNANDIEKGIGDDAAITRVPAGARLVSCIDTLVQGRHFAGDWEGVEALAFEIGYKSVAVNVSDVAAMGATALRFDKCLLVAIQARLDGAVQVGRGQIG